VRWPCLKPEAYKKKEDLRYFVGQEIEMNDHRAVIVGVCEASRTFQSNPVIYTTYSRAKSYIAQERKVLSYILAKVDEPKGKTLTPEERLALHAKVAIEVKRQTGLLALSSQDFLWKTINYYLKYTGIPINFGITAALGFLVGTAIAGQTFYNFTLENLKQFGALKAMGATNGRIIGMILLQATVSGLLGYGIGVGLAALFGFRVQGSELAFFTPWQLLPITGGAVVLICILASLLSVRRVMVLEPAVVFRG
jgi:putative ABC transport system permease protein